MRATDAVEDLDDDFLGALPEPEPVPVVGAAVGAAVEVVGVVGGAGSTTSSEDVEVEATGQGTMTATDGAAVGGVLDVAVGKAVGEAVGDSVTIPPTETQSCAINSEESKDEEGERGAKDEEGAHEGEDTAKRRSDDTQRNSSFATHLHELVLAVRRAVDRAVIYSTDDDLVHNTLVFAGMHRSGRFGENGEAA